MGYVLVGNPYYEGGLRKPEEEMNCQAINSDRIYNVEFSHGERLVDQNSRLDRRGFAPNTTVHFARILIDSLMLTKHSDEASVVEEVKSDFQNILKVLAGDAKVANLSDFEVEAAAPDASDAAPTKKSAPAKQEPKQEAPAEAPKRQSTRSSS